MTNDTDSTALYSALKSISLNSKRDEAMTSVSVPQSIYNEIIAHAREGKPEEICGILCGRGLEAKRLIRGRNIAAERIENYEVDPQTLLKGVRSNITRPLPLLESVGDRGVARIRRYM